MSQNDGTKKQFPSPLRFSIASLTRAGPAVRQHPVHHQNHSNNGKLNPHRGRAPAQGRTPTRQNHHAPPRGNRKAHLLYQKGIHQELFHRQRRQGAHHRFFRIKPADHLHGQLSAPAAQRRIPAVPQRLRAALAELPPAAVLLCRFPPGQPDRKDPCGKALCPGRNALQAIALQKPPATLPAAHRPASKHRAAHHHRLHRLLPWHQPGDAEPNQKRAA